MSVWRWVSDKSRVRQLPSWREFCARVERACILFWRQNCEAARDWQGERVIRQVDWAILDQEMNDQWALQFASIYVSVLRWNMGSKCEKSQFHLWGSSEPSPPRVGFQKGGPLLERILTVDDEECKWICESSVSCIADVMGSNPVHD